MTDYWGALICSQVWFAVGIVMPGGWQALGSGLLGLLWFVLALGALRAERSISAQRLPQEKP